MSELFEAKNLLGKTLYVLKRLAIFVIKKIYKTMRALLQRFIPKTADSKDSAENVKKPIAIIISNYNMPEYVDRHVEFFRRTTQWPYDLIVVDNASDKMPPSSHTTLQLKENVGPNGAWQMALAYADRLERKRKAPYWGYLLCTTNFIIPEDQKNKDYVTIMAQHFLNNETAVFINPAHTQDSQTWCSHMKDTRSGKPRQVYFVEPVCALIRASWFKKAGRLESEFYHNWGIDLDICVKAKRQKRSLWVHEGILVKKIAEEGYNSGRFEMTAAERSEKASAEEEAVFQRKYGLSKSDLYVELKVRHFFEVFLAEICSKLTFWKKREKKEDEACEHGK